MLSKLKGIRSQMGLTQAEFAKELAVPLAEFRQLERGEVPLSSLYVIRIIFLAGLHGLPDLEPDDICDAELAAEVKELLDQAGPPLDEFELEEHVGNARAALRAAIGLVAEEMGSGVAVGNPQLVAAALSAITASFQRETVQIAALEVEEALRLFGAFVQEFLEYLPDLPESDAVYALASALESHAEAMPIFDSSAIENLARAIDSMPDFDSSELVAALSALIQKLR